MLEQFVLNEFHPTFVIDALETSRPMNFEVTTPSEIMQTFDAIAYNKGFSVGLCALIIKEVIKVNKDFVK